MSALVDLVAGARPNFVKLAPVCHALADWPSVQTRIVHTGQHYDSAMDRVFFEELGMPAADVNLEVGSATHGKQTALILERYEAHLLDRGAAATVVFGDVNSTVACALAASKLGVPVVHVEAGLRSFDRSMPEEINRIVTDAISDLLLVSEPSGLSNLEREGVPDDKVVQVGNVMIDSLKRCLPYVRELAVPQGMGLEPGQYGFVTMHRPSNVDDPLVLEALLTLLRQLSSDLPLVFAVHPRTRGAAAGAGIEALLEPTDRFLTTEPQPYFASIGLMASAAVVLTDSGGIQEETSVLGIPCLTLRPNTERPITVELGTSRLVGNDVGAIADAFQEACRGAWPTGGDIALWDGAAGGRIAQAIVGLMDARR